MICVWEVDWDEIMETSEKNQYFCRTSILRRQILYRIDK
jgi:hypothetical protein